MGGDKPTRRASFFGYDMFIVIVVVPSSNSDVVNAISFHQHEGELLNRKTSIFAVTNEDPLKLNIRVQAGCWMLWGDGQVRICSALLD